MHQACFKRGAEALARSFGRRVHNNEAMPSNSCCFLSLRCVPEAPTIHVASDMGRGVWMCVTWQWLAFRVRVFEFKRHGSMQRVNAVCSLVCDLVLNARGYVCVCVVLRSWELRGSKRRGSLIQCFEMSPPAVVGLKDCSLGGSLEMMRCSFYLYFS